MKKRENPNEEEIIRLAQSGDSAAMHALYCRHARYLAAVCARYVAGAEDARDVLQNGFLRIFSSIRTFEYRGEGSLRGWMTRIVVNEALKYIRQACRSDFADLSHEHLKVPEEEPDTENIPASVLHDMIRQLPDGYRTVFNLYVLEEKSHREIARMLDIKESTSASQLHRAKALLADKIERYRNSNSIPPCKRNG